MKFKIISSIIVFVVLVVLFFASINNADVDSGSGEQSVEVSQ